MQTVAIPATTSGSQLRLTDSVSATSEGMLSLSGDGQFVAFGGYDAAVGTTGVASSSTGTVQRVLGRAKYDGTLDTSTSTTDISGNNIRSVVTNDGTQYWAAGGAGGVRYFGTIGTTGVTGNGISSQGNTRTVEIFFKRLYWGTGAGSNRGVFTFTDALPTSNAGQTDTAVATNGGSASPYQFVFIDMDNSGGLSTDDRLYQADDSGGAQSLTRYTYNGTTFGAGTRIASGQANLRGLTGVKASGTTGTAFTATATGVPAPTFSLVGTSGVDFPSWLSITLGGALQVAAHAAVTQTTPNTFTIKATNGVSPDATQVFTLYEVPAATATAAFTPGNLLVFRVGDGGTTYGSQGSGGSSSGVSAGIFLDEYTPAGTFVQTVFVPTQTAGGNLATSESISATSDGMLTLSADGHSLVFTGYNAAPGTAGIAGTSTTGAGAVPRVIGSVNAAGVVTVNTTTTAYSGNNIRGAATVDGLEFWTAGTGTPAGVRYNGMAGTANVGQSVTNTSNTRTVAIFNGQLYFGTGSATGNVGPGGSGPWLAAPSGGQSVDGGTGLSAGLARGPHPRQCVAPARPGRVREGAKGTCRPGHDPCRPGQRWRGRRAIPGSPPPPAGVLPRPQQPGGCPRTPRQERRGPCLLPGGAAAGAGVGNRPLQLG